jgi:hypothetical protein
MLIPTSSISWRAGGACLLLLLALASCYVVTEERDEKGSWDLPEANETGVTPSPGVYSFSEEGLFEVAEDDGAYVLRFSVDGYRWDEIEIENGGFRYAWGEINGTDCPTDSYAISGGFVEPTRAEGVIKYASGCDLKKKASFVAEQQTTD